MKPFGILMPNWNKERYIGAALDSLFKQTDPNWYLAVADDASTDSSVKKLLIRQDHRIGILLSDERRGPGAASARAWSHLRWRGVEHVGILDSDDALHPDAVRLVREAYARNPDAGVIYTQNYRCREDLSVIERGRARAIAPGETALSTQEKENTLPVNHWLTFTAEAYAKTEGFAALERHQDMDLIFKLEEVSKMVFLDEPLYYYRILEDGLHTGRVVPDFAPKVREWARARRAAQHSRMP